MKIEEFTGDLPTYTNCDRCSVKISVLDWSVGKFGASDFIGLCIVKCEECMRVKIAAAGSSHQAHHRAQMIRTELLVRMGKAGSDGLKNDINRLLQKK
jgi:hypothetical protein